jgi:hypothetical protein
MTPTFYFLSHLFVYWGCHDRNTNIHMKLALLGKVAIAKLVGHASLAHRSYNLLRV